MRVEIMTFLGKLGNATISWKHEYDVTWLTKDGHPLFLRFYKNCVEKICY